MIMAMIALNPSVILATTVPSSGALNNALEAGTSTIEFKSSLASATNAQQRAVDPDGNGDYINGVAEEHKLEERDNNVTYGGAIMNTDNTIGDIEANFIDNTSGGVAGDEHGTGFGGAIFNGKSETGTSIIGDITGNFTGNQAGGVEDTGTGGAIANLYDGANTNYRPSVIGDITGNFTDNIAYGGEDCGSGGGGAIYNALSIIGDITGDFTNNTAYGALGSLGGSSKGGAIHQIGVEFQELRAKIGHIEGSFTGNKVEILSGNAHGGAIWNDYSDIESITGDFKKNAAISNGVGYGGAIVNHESGKMGIIKGDFKENYALGVAGARGGAIYNLRSHMDSIIGDFIGNYAESTREGTSAWAGAIHNALGTMDNITGDFIGNYAIAPLQAVGGAIVNDKTMVLRDSSFRDNYAEATDGSAFGGAIYNTGTLSVYAVTKDSLFTGNTIKWTYKEAGKEDIKVISSNAINNAGTLNLNAGKGLEVVFNDTINGNKGTININKEDTDRDAPVEGTIVFNNTVMGQTINLIAGTLKMGSVIDDAGEATSYGDFTDTVTLNVEDGTTIDHRDSSAHIMNVGTLNLNGNVDVYLDADLLAKTIDHYNPLELTVAEGVKLNVTAIKILTDSKDLITEVNFTEHIDLKDQVTWSDLKDVEVYAPIFKYNIAYNSENGNFIFERMEGGAEVFNPSILVTPAAAQIGAYMAQVNSFEQAFSNYDMITSLHNKHRQALYNQRAKTSNGTFWVRPYSSFGDINYSMIPSVDEFTYGTYVGVDSAVKELGSKWSLIYSAYAGYNGSEQKFEGVHIQQSGGLMGMSALVYKENFWTSITVNVGALNANADTMYGPENFNMFTSGVATKTGYNFELQGGNYILQPNVQFSYSYVDTEDHKNASGVAIVADDLHAFQLVPGLRLISNVSQEWQPYIDVRMVWNLNDKSSFTADGHELPSLSMDPYVEYSAGTQWHYSENIRFNAAVMMRAAGRRGGSLNLGMSWSM